MRNMRSLEGKIALVTGASRGAGRGIAVELGKAGATVYVTGRSVQGRSTKDWPGTLDKPFHKLSPAGGPAWQSVVIIPGMKKWRL